MHPPHAFATTRWTAVLTAGHADTTRARAALAELCQTYWFPLYAYARRRGFSAVDAEDLTQGFFERLLRPDSLAGITRDTGKFRAFLLAAMNNFINDHWRRNSAQRRSVKHTISLDGLEAEGRYRAELACAQTPERAFERQWALTLLEKVVNRLNQEYAAADKHELFLELRFAITAESSKVPYAQLAETLHMSEEGARVAVHRLRQRYRKLLCDEIAQTVAEPADVADELNYLRSVLSS